MRVQAQNVSKVLTETQFFILFWTIVLGPFEYLILSLPVGSVVMIRIVAIGSNIVWYKYWFDRKFWNKYLPKDSTKKPDLPVFIRIVRMVTMKFLVNVTNFTFLFCITMLLVSIYDTGLHFTLMGFVKKVGFITLFAVILTTPYEWLRKELGFEKNKPSEVGLTSDI